MKRLISSVLVVLGIASYVVSAPVFFTDNSFSGAGGNTTFYNGTYGITLDAEPRNTWPLSDATLTWNNDFGIGINYGLIDISDEIDYPEVLTITFDNEVNLESLYISKLFHDEYTLDFGFFQFTVAEWDEEGIYKLSTGETGEFITENENGELIVDVNRTVKSVKLSAKAENVVDIFAHDFSVRGVSYTSVPEPAVLSFLGISLLSLGFFRSRKK
ncbi:MAG TPA: hypothetical protein VKY57_12255 [Chitinispirillaceae bacterium]|nr:hypothetical protein [Chitinispirillaceae bacterium]